MNVCIYSLSTTPLFLPQEDFSFQILTSSKFNCQKTSSLSNQTRSSL